MKHEAGEKVSGPLFSLLILPVMRTPTWQEFAAAIRASAENAHKYYTYLEEKADICNAASSPLLSAPFEMLTLALQSSSPKQMLGSQT